jgi:2-dehydropantoate 2-reductase
VIVGAGAIGCALAGMLARTGCKVICVARPAIVEALKSGITLRLEDETLTVVAEAVSRMQDLEPRDGDVLILTMKSQDTESAVRELSRVYPASTPIVCLQNGIRNEEIARRRFNRVYAGLVFFSATQWAVTDVLVPKERRVAIGLSPEGLDALANRIAADLSRAGFESMASAYVMPMKHGKLIANLNNATHAITGYWLELGAVDPEMRRLMVRVREEGLRVLEAAGIPAEPPLDEPSPIRIIAMTEKMRQAPDPAAREEAARLPEEARTHASMWQDLYMGRRTNEAEFLNGEIVRLGESLGIPTPYNSALLDIVTRMFEEGLSPGIYTPAELGSLIEARHSPKA